jgi:nucleoside-diphosphate-sugar epimerase
MEQHKPKFSLTTICPPWIFGPLLNEPSSMSKLNESAETIYKLFDGSTKESPPTDFAAFADVRDVALAHLLEFEKPEAANQRFLIAGGQFGYQAAADIIRKNIPELKDRTPVGSPRAGAEEKTYIANGSKTEKVLGLKYHSLISQSQTLRVICWQWKSSLQLRMLILAVVVSMECILFSELGMRDHYCSSSISIEVVCMVQVKNRLPFPSYDFIPSGRN